MNIQITEKEVVAELQGFKITAPVAALQKALAPDTGFRSHLVRYQSKNACVLEFSPRYITVKGSGKEFTGKGDNEVYHLPMPWIVVIYARHKLYLFCRREEMESLDDEVYYLPLPHIKNDGSPCWGGDSWQGVDKEPDMAHEVIYMLHKYFLSGFRGGMYFNMDDNQRKIHIPDEILAANVITKTGLWMDQPKYFHWLEAQTLTDMCVNYTYKPAGKVSDYIKKVEAGQKAVPYTQALIEMIKNLPGAKVVRV